ncbi:uncharacterized protein [Nicotiana sylvestris]|uniref:uncharacterized protein n=1 Tax=Nicotiana sylvestris TaxID=4096 RepID=UPI00388CB758
MRMQKKEKFESVLRKSKKQKKKRRLVKDGKVINEKVVPFSQVVNVDDEVEEELGSLVRKFSKKLIVPKSKRESSVVEKELRRVDGQKYGEKESDKIVEESCEHVAEKFVKKGKSARKLVKRKGNASKQRGPSKRAKVDGAYNARKEKLKNQKVLWGRTFPPNILDMAGMHQLVEICEFQ